MQKSNKGKNYFLISVANRDWVKVWMLWNSEIMKILFNMFVEIRALAVSEDERSWINVWHDILRFMISIKSKAVILIFVSSGPSDFREYICVYIPWNTSFKSHLGSSSSWKQNKDKLSTLFMIMVSFRCEIKIGFNLLCINIECSQLLKNRAKLS